MSPRDSASKNNGISCATLQVPKIRFLRNFTGEQFSALAGRVAHREKNSIEVSNVYEISRRIRICNKKWGFPFEITKLMRKSRICARAQRAKL